MLPLFRSAIRAVLTVLVLVNVRPVRADIIYDNSTPTANVTPWWSIAEYGDEVQFGGTNRILTQFQIEYYGDFVPNGDETGRVRLYANDGPILQTDGAPTPSTLLYESDVFPIHPGIQTWSSGAIRLPVPDRLTWTIQFSGVGVSYGDESGVLLRNPPTVGSSFNDYWSRTTRGWRTFVIPGLVANFGARFNGEARISVRRAGDRIVLEWSGASILQYATSVNGPYTDLPEYNNVFSFPAKNAAKMFWQLRD